MGWLALALARARGVGRGLDSPGALNIAWVSFKLVHGKGDLNSHCLPAPGPCPLRNLHDWENYCGADKGIEKSTQPIMHGQL